MCIQNLMRAILVAAVASSSQGVLAQTVREPCAKALHQAAYAQNPADKRKQLEAFTSNKCVADIMNVFGAAGVPKPGDGSALAMATIAYKSLLDQTADRKPSIGSAGVGSGSGSGGAVAATVMSVDEIIKRMNAGDGGVATGAGNPAAKPAVGPSK